MKTAAEFAAFAEAAGVRVEKDCPLSPLSSFRIGGCAEYALFPSTAEQLCTVVREADRRGVRCAVFGNASNVLFDDAGFEGAAVFCSALRKISAEPTEGTVAAECGVSLRDLTLAAEENGLSGLEFAYGIPGSVGGAVYMNAGAYGGEMKDAVVSSTAYDRKTGEIITLHGEEHLFGYRDSFYLRGGDRYVILGAVFSLKADGRAEVRARMDDFLNRRKEKQPLNFPSAGSVFKRYPGYFTGKLIEEAGLKGRTVGGAQVSEKHAGFIVNRGGATAADVKALVEIIREEVFRREGIRIECEIRFIPEKAEARYRPDTGEASS